MYVFAAMNSDSTTYLICGRQMLLFSGGKRAASQKEKQIWVPAVLNLKSAYLNLISLLLLLVVCNEPSLSLPLQ